MRSLLECDFGDACLMFFYYKSNDEIGWMKVGGTKNFNFLKVLNISAMLKLNNFFYS